MQAIRDTCRRAGDDPELGRHRPDLGAEVRSKVVLEYPYAIYYRHAPSRLRARVQVIRVLHQARDVGGAFSEDPVTD